MGISTGPALRESRSTCAYCGVGCGVVIQSQGAQVVGVRGDPDHPANRGRLCSKGQSLHQTMQPHLLTNLRAREPLLRSSRDQQLAPASWDKALDTVAQRLAHTINIHGPGSVGLYLSGQLLTEDYYAFNKLARGLIGTHNVDTNSRLCMSSAVAGYKASFGADTVPACYEDIEHAACVFITGSNMAWAHPVLYRRLEAARAANPAMKVVVVDPRRTETAAEADLHLQILPGTDVALHHAMLHLMLWEGLVDTAYIAAHTSGFAALRDRVRAFTPVHAAGVCGVKEEAIVTAARWFAGVEVGPAGLALGEATSGATSTRKPTLSLWCQGLNQSSSGTAKNTSLLNLHLATGQMGKPGAGPLSLTGQPNAMGGREVGGLATALSAHRDPSNPVHRAEVAQLWGIEELPSTPGLTAVQMFEAAADGQIKALWIACTNPVQSLPDQALVRRALQRCEFVVLQEAYRHTATAAFADVFLPATSWAEKEGTVTNSERCISRVRAAVPAPGQARADWRIAVDVARRLAPLLPGRATHLFPYENAEAIWLEHRESTRGRDVDITGLSYAMLEAQARPWPWAQGQTEPTPRLFTQGQFTTPDGRARFIDSAYSPTAENRDAHYPVSLTSGRLRDQWHGLSRSGTVPALWAHGGEHSEPCVQLHPQELERRRWAEGTLLTLRSRRGELILPVRASASVQPAQAYVAMHWGPEHLPGRLGGGVNVLMPRASCPQSKQPELKHAAIRFQKAELPWQFAAALWCPSERAPTLRERIRSLLAVADYAACIPFADERDATAAVARTGLWLRAASAAAPDAAWLKAVQTLVGLDANSNSQALRYADPRLGRSRIAQLDAQGRLQAFMLAGDSAAAHWMLAWLKQAQHAAPWGRALLAGAADPPVATAALSPVVCSCGSVREASIEAALLAFVRSPANAARLPSSQACIAHLQSHLNCGALCGSCLPATKALVARHLQTHQATTA